MMTRGVMASERQRKRRQQRRVRPPGDRTQQLLRSGLDPDAPSALALRQLWVAPEALALRDEVRGLIMTGFPYAADPESREPLEGVVDAAVGWDVLEQLHDYLTGRMQQLLDDRGSAEWLWWLRRLRGQFDDVNTMASTGPYVQGVAECLAAGWSRRSRPADSPRFEFELTGVTLIDLVWLREVSILIYRLHAVMKRCAKGQRVVLVPGALPVWEPDDDLDDAIEDYDDRSERESANLFQSVGVSPRKRDIEQVLASDAIGGLVPQWFQAGVSSPPRFDKTDPIPTLFEWLDLDVVEPLCDQNVLTKEQVALIALLWACFNIGVREPELALRRLTAPIQWGYMLTGTENYLLRALDEMAEWMQQGAGRALTGCWLPQSGSEILDVLRSIKPEVWPPLCGNPVHEAGPLSVVDLVGATRRLYATLVRPSDGSDVNLWSAHFESDVQAVIDATPWRPPDPLRFLIKRIVRRRDRTTLTDIDALAYQNGRLLLVSCKSIAFTVPALRGEFAITRNIVGKIHDAAAAWDDTVAEVRGDPSILHSEIARDSEIEGCVAFPSVPFSTDPRWRRDVFGMFPYLLSLSELKHALA